MCHDHRMTERDRPAEEAEAAADASEAALERALSGEDGRVFVPPAD